MRKWDWILMGVLGGGLPMLSLFAGDRAPICLGISALPKLQNCDDNESLGKEALRCTREYYHYVQASQKEILEKFQEEINQMKEQQTDSFNRTKAGYLKTRERLLALIQEGKSVRAAVDGLALSMEYPEDYDQPSITGMSKEKYLATEDCYAVPKRVMNQSRAMLDKIMNDISLVEQTAFGKQNNSQNSSADLQNSEPDLIGAKAPNAGGGGPTGFRKTASGISEASDAPAKVMSNKKSKKNRKQKNE